MAFPAFAYIPSGKCYPEAFILTIGITSSLLVVCAFAPVSPEFRLGNVTSVSDPSDQTVEMGGHSFLLPVCYCEVRERHLVTYVIPLTPSLPTDPCSYKQQGYSTN